MRGADITQETLFTMATLDDFVPDDPPLRAIGDLTDQALRRMSGLFSTLYADTGRHSIPPEKLLRAAHATRRRISRAKSVATIRMPRPAIPMPGCSERAIPARNCAIKATC